MKLFIQFKIISTFAHFIHQKFEISKRIFPKVFHNHAQFSTKTFFEKFLNVYSVWFMSVNKIFVFRKKQAIKFHEKKSVLHLFALLIFRPPERLIQIYNENSNSHSRKKSHFIALQPKQTTWDGSEGRKTSNIDFLQRKSLQYVIGMFAIKLSPQTQKHRAKLRGRKCEEFSFSCFH